MTRRAAVTRPSGARRPTGPKQLDFRRAAGRGFDLLGPGSVDFGGGQVLRPCVIGELEHDRIDRVLARGTIQKICGRGRDGTT